MQTFLPSKDFKECAKVLDKRRLNKQKVECYQILKTLHLGDKAKGWRNHPIIKAWRNHEETLIEYSLTIAQECLNRGMKDTLIPKITEFKQHFKNTTYPNWLGDVAFHDTHKSNLMRKEPEYYKQFNWNVPNNLPYIWPN
jgi:hypothetical protein